MKSSLTPARFPCLVAHRGAKTVAPENTLPAFAIALAQGAREVEFDLWPTADGEVAVCHDATLDRATTGSGPIAERTWEYIRGLDAGVKFGPAWQGERVPSLTQLFRFLAARAVMNIHIKDPGAGGFVIERVRELAESLHVSEQVHIAGDCDVLAAAREQAPGIARCCLAAQFDPPALIRHALDFGCRRVQFGVGATTDDDISRARDLGLITNYFFCDDPAEGKRLLEVGVMALLTNCYGKMRHLDYDALNRDVPPGESEEHP